MAIKKKGDVPERKAETKAKRKGEDELSGLLSDVTRDVRTSPDESTDKRKKD